MTISSLAPGVLPRRFTEVGRIRLGDKSDKGAPRKLTKFRITTSHADLLARVADVYGGTPRPWDAAPTGRGTQHELYVESEVLDVMVPPGQVLTQAYELWSGGGCQRRCNGVATETGEPCMCPVDPEERNALALKGKACRLTTRLSVWMPKIPGIAVWRLESHGAYAAMELPGAAELLSMASEQGTPIPATLRIASRVVKRNGETKQFIVPQLDPAISVGSMFAIARGERPAELEPSTGPVHTLTERTGMPEAKAIEAPKRQPTEESKQLMVRLRALPADAADELRAMAAAEGKPIAALAFDDDPDWASSVTAIVAGLETPPPKPAAEPVTPDAVTTPAA